MNTELIFPNLAAMKMFPVLASFIAVTSNDPTSFVAIGMSASVIITVFEAQKNKVGIFDLGAKITVTMVGGITLPSILQTSGVLQKYAPFINPKNTELTWQIWLLLGFIAGTLSWSLYIGFSRMAKSLIKLKFDK